MGHRWLWAVALASILIFQIGSFGNVISPTSDITGNKSESDDSSADRNQKVVLTDSEIDEQIVEAQGSFDCLLAEKPDCRPTVDETSEFLGGSVSIQVVLPDNPDPQSTESWTSEEIEEILRSFMLLSLPPGPLGPPAPPIESPCTSSFKVPPEEVLNAVIDFLIDSKIFTLPGSKVGLEFCRVLQFPDKTVVEVMIEVELPNGFSRFIPFEMSVSASLATYNLVRAQKEAVEMGVACAIPNPTALYDAGGQVCGQIHAPPPSSGRQSPPGSIEPSSLWINAVMNELIVNGTNKYFDPNPDNFYHQVKKFANDVRQKDGTDWAVVVFVVDSSHHEGMFADGTIAWTQLGGPYMTITNKVGPYGFDNFSVAFLHELLHMFYALDEYNGSFDQTTFSGYVPAQNRNHEDSCGAVYNCGDPSIMKRLTVDLLDLVSQGVAFAFRLPDPCPGVFDCADPQTGAEYDVLNCRSSSQCYVLEWHNQNYNGTDPPFWVFKIPAGPQWPFKENATYRFGTYYQVIDFGTNSTASMEAWAFDIAGNSQLIASRTLEGQPQGTGIFEFESMEFTVPPGTFEIHIYFTRCDVDIGEGCLIFADKNFQFTGDWVFENEIDRFAAQMIGFIDSDGDGIFDPQDTFPAIKIDNKFLQRITLTLDENFFSSNVYNCLFETPKGSGNIYVNFGFGTNQDAQVVDRRGPCGQVADIDLLGRDPVVTIGLERCIDSPPGACGRIDEPPPPASIDIQASDNFSESDDAVNIQLAQPGQPFLLIQAEEGSTPINGTAVSVFPSDLNGNSGGLTPFKMFYATDYRMGDPILGYVFDVPQRNLNPFGSHNSVTINKIIQTQYCRDEGKPTCDNWVDTHAADGAFDEAGEDFVFTPAVRPGINTIFVRANNTVGNLSGEDPFPITPTMKAIVLNVSTVGPPECGGKSFTSVIVGTSQNDILLGTSGADLILGFEGNDEIRGKRGADCLLGGDGNDIIYGNKGADTMLGDEGDDTLLGGLGNDKLDGGDDFDTCKGGAGTNTKKNCEA